MKVHIYSVLFLAFNFLFLVQCKPDPKTPEEVVVDYKRISNDVIVGMVSEADNLNPLLATSAYSSLPINHIFQTLIAINPEDLELIPLLAKQRPEAEEREDGSVAYTFDIREEE